MRPARQSGRDGARTPMPWKQNNQYAGFSETKPWLPVDPRHLPGSVGAQNDDTNSVLNFYRNAMSLRSNSVILKQGDLTIIPSDEGLLVFDRTLHGNTIRVVINLTDQPFGFSDCEGEVLLQTSNFKTGQIPTYSGALISR